ncbi:MAG: MarR family transcriptional regulator [Methanomicrobiales archaeon]|nr:MarR family transcriptional regulator [Methanomicrobiales archaeon]
MADEILDQVAEYLLGLMPFYHKYIVRTGFGITGQQTAQYRVLGVLTKAGPLPMSEVGKRLYISKPYMTVLVDTLIEQALVERRSDPSDRRVVQIAITARGTSYLKQSVNLYKEDLKEFLSTFSEQDLAVLCQSLENLHSVLVKMP